MPDAAVTLSPETIHNPAEPRHFMRLKPITRRVRILRRGVALADSRAALRLLEVGRDVYDPVIYLPRTDVMARLSQTSKRSRCPLKGSAAYFDLLDDTGEMIEEEIAWAYPAPVEPAAVLADLIAFYPARVTVEESPV